MAAEHLNSRIFSHAVVWLDGGPSQAARSGDHKICSVHKTVTSPDWKSWDLDRDAQIYGKGLTYNLSYGSICHVCCRKSSVVSFRRMLRLYINLCTLPLIFLLLVWDSPFRS